MKRHIVDLFRRLVGQPQLAAQQADLAARAARIEAQLAAQQADLAARIEAQLAAQQADLTGHIEAMIARSRLDPSHELKARYAEPFPGGDFHWFQEYSVTQTLIFYTDLLPYLHYLLQARPWGTEFSILDAGCGSGAGANFWGMLHRNEFLGHKYHVTGIDVVNTYKQYAEVAFPHMSYVVGDIFDMKPDSFDAVVCSHVIEHFADASNFIRQLQKIGRLFSLFYCPFEEQQLLEGHLRSINREFIGNFSPAIVEIRESVAWRHPRDERSRCAVFVLPGRDWASLQRQSIFNWEGKTSALPLACHVGG